MLNAPDFRTEWREETASTNSDARSLAEAGERGPLWIAAKRQTAGRGRRGRSWSGMDGNLFTTGLFTFSADPGEVATLSFAAALAVAEVCDTAGIDPARTKLKWPNDVLVDDRKLAGILLESGAAPGGGMWLAVGIGINIAQAPALDDRPVAAINSAGGATSRETALDVLAGSFGGWLKRWTVDGFGPIRDHWLMRAHGLGAHCRAQLGEETVRGVFADLAPDGSLRLDLASGERRYISAGEVFF